MKVTQIAIGRFHQFHLARQMEKHGLPDKIYTGYPMFKLKDEAGIPKDKVKTFPWIHAPYMKRGILGLDKWEWLNNEWAWIDHELLDKFVASKLKDPTILIALSGSGLHAAKVNKLNGGINICDRGSSHIRFQDEILREEHERWGVKFAGIDPRIIDKEEAEYELADYITIPSEFSKRTFLDFGISENKLIKTIYGANLSRFKKISDPIKDKFRVLWVGGVSMQKGFFYLLEAFKRTLHPNKELFVIGAMSIETNSLLKNMDLNNVIFKGNIANSELPLIYSQSNVFVLPSIQDGFGMVMGEALACGCPVVASTNTGAQDLFTDGVEGFIVPIRSVDALTEKLQLLAENHDLRQKMSEAALKRVQSFGGWETYGNNFAQLIKRL